MCCGRTRSILRNAFAQASAMSASTRAAQPVSGAAGRTGLSRFAQGSAPSVTLRCTDTAPVRVWGPVTGRRYDFSGAEAAQPVDAGDAAVLLRSGVFRRA